jgi:predicted DNA-binding transcriptional regulator AlpA
MNKFISVPKASKDYGVTPQAIYHAIKIKRLRARTRPGARCPEWLVCADDLERVFTQKYARCNSVDKHGNPLFDKSRGEMGISQAAKVLQMTHNQIYYSIRKGKLPYTRKACKENANTYVFTQADINEFKSHLKEYLALRYVKC